ncbi:ubiquitin-specific protease UBP10 SKDI_14G1400 [Saccharomyces kudriavzevii IFO 1802]|uniref:ubiquitinyl hydrolase 1 n=1 Tax=Saccharomyces kudriavzevii (strain ATCC MYA-4449 / AS 2.2408 / CBS 8840 / NBRC 1802 / NCYC 2889) TaxID=226230 RepID=A0AA35J5J8_SACK1|nr:uncharacterized protein SKDI_14G1400 [Saccharomyces kudriavzevii IFO 1802]CAI4049676.1 hypothetical protein SKDI_14G1400 [Saccharomyces kudriavzevii IFO 1802]
MTTQESIKPLVDRILSNPLQFNAAMISKKSNNSNNNGTSAASQNGSYIVIGKQHNNNSGSSATTETTSSEQVQGNDLMEKSRDDKKSNAVPKSMAEALLLYTSKSIKDANDVTAVKKSAELSTELSTEPPTSASEDDKEEINEEEAEVFHEAREYIEPQSVNLKENDMVDEDVGEDIGEDLGMPIPTIDVAVSKNEKQRDFSASTNVEGDEVDDEDEDEDMNYDSSAMEKELPEEEETDSSSTISENEKKDLRQDLMENNTVTVNQCEMQSNHAGENEGENTKEEEEEEEPELEHKLRSATPPTTISNLSNFYQFNENANDHGSLNSTRVIKNWGDQFTNLKPRGLLNHGVTCYTNAAVQAMLHIPAIQHYLFDVLLGKYDSTISKNSVSYTLAETSKKMWLPLSKNYKKNSPASYINPKHLISRLDDINCMMSEWQQEDSHEYFMSLMSRLQEDSVPKGHKLIESIIYDIFGGLLKQIVTCKSCGSTSKTEQPFYDLSLHLKGKRRLDSNPDLLEDNNSSTSAACSSTNSNTTIAQSSSSHSVSANIHNATPDAAVNDLNSVNRRFSIEKSIRDFFNPELIKVDKEQKGYVCEKCHKTTNAVKHNSILRAPETLLVHLKKFRFNGTSSSKMKQAVSYPMFLDLTEYCDDKDLPVKYQLLSVVVHEGRSLSSGHYIAHCKQPDGNWATYDDEYINKISERDVLKEPNAYYLLYTRLTPKLISLPLAKSNTTAHDVTPSEYKQEQITSESNKRPLKINSKKNNRKKWKKNKKRKFSK